MGNAEIRKPIQKRSIEKKKKIIHAGFELICQKGYYNTNTAEIAKDQASTPVSGGEITVEANVTIVYGYNYED